MNHMISCCTGNLPIVTGNKECPLCCAGKHIDQ
jgi:hypothetical protein